MPAVRPQLDRATVAAFLRHLGASVEDLRGLRGGEICTAFAYTLAGARSVIRFSTMESGFVRKRQNSEHNPPGRKILREK